MRYGGGTRNGRGRKCQRAYRRDRAAFPRPGGLDVRSVSGAASRVQGLGCGVSGARSDTRTFHLSEQRDAPERGFGDAEQTHDVTGGGLERVDRCNSWLGPFHHQAIR